MPLAVQELSILLPAMSANRLLQLNRNLLAQLVADTAGASVYHEWDQSLCRKANANGWSDQMA